MRTHHLLWSASVISFLLAVGHTLGGKDSWSPVGELDILRAMRTTSFTTAGVTRTFYDFFMGFGWCISVFLLLQAVVLWQLASIARTNPRATRPMIASFFLATVASGIIAWRMLVPPPVVFDGLIALILAAAFLVASRQPQSVSQ